MRRRPTSRKRPAPEAASSSSEASSAAACALDGLPDRVLLRVLQELPRPDLLRVARVSSRLHGLTQDGTLWRDLGTLGPDVATDQACLLLRNAPHLTALKLQDRHDADAVLLEASRYCRGLESLELVRCRGSPTFRHLAYMPLVKVAQSCPRLRRVHFHDTEFMSSRVFKVWADLRGAEAPPLELGVHCLSRRQAKYLTDVLGGPPQLHELALRAEPLLLRVQGHELSLQCPQCAEAETETETEEAEAATQSPPPLPPLPAGLSPCWPAVAVPVAASAARVRAAPSASASSLQQEEERRKRPRLESGQDDAQPTPTPSGVAAAEDDVCTVFVRPACAPSTSAGWHGSHPCATAEDSSDEDIDGDLLDVVVASPTAAEAEGADPHPATPRPYRPVFGMACTSEPSVNDSWFRTGYIPDFGENQQEEQPSDPVSEPGALRTTLLLPEDGSDGPGVEVLVTAVVEAGGVAALRLRSGVAVLPAGALRLAASLREPLDPSPPSPEAPAGDQEHREHREHREPAFKAPAQVAAKAATVRGAQHHGAVDGDHGEDRAFRDV